MIIKKSILFPLKRLGFRGDKLKEAYYAFVEVPDIIAVQFLEKLAHRREHRIIPS